MKCKNCKGKAEKHGDKYYCPVCKIWFTHEMTETYVKGLAEAKRSSLWK